MTSRSAPFAKRALSFLGRLASSGRADSTDRVAHKYTGSTAAEYEHNRSHGVKWRTESAIVERILESLPPGRSVLDIPVGTGRFLPLYDRLGMAATGMDVSSDMLSIAREKNVTAKLRLGNIRQIAANDASYDCVLCVRFLNWVDRQGLHAALRELGRVTRSDVIVSVSVYAPGLVRTIRGRVSHQLNRWRTPLEPVTTIHPEATFHQYVHAAGLTVKSVDCVERAADGGVAYNIYHLVRSGENSRVGPAAK